MALGRYVVSSLPAAPLTSIPRTCAMLIAYFTGAMLEEPIVPGDTSPPKMKGSAMLVGAKTKEEVIERVKKDIYVDEGVWDTDKIQIIPFKSALRKAL